MKRILSVVVAAVFAAASFNAMSASHAGAQGMDKKKDEVKSKDGKAVTTKDGKKVESKEEKKK